MSKRKAGDTFKKEKRPFKKSQRSFQQGVMTNAYLARTNMSMKPEVKTLDFPKVTQEFSLAANFSTLNLVQVGTSFYQRIGRKISMKSLNFSGYIVATRTINAQDLGRVILLYDRQCNGALPLLADVLQNVDQTGAATTTSNSSINMNNRDRFLILRDMRIYLPSAQNAAGVVTNASPEDPIHDFGTIKFHVKLNGLLGQFKADSNPAVIGDIATGSLLLLVMGSQTAGNPGWSLVYETRLRYWDS